MVRSGSSAGGGQGRATFSWGRPRGLFFVYGCVLTITYTTASLLFAAMEKLSSFDRGGGGGNPSLEMG